MALSLSQRELLTLCKNAGIPEGSCFFPRDVMPALAGNAGNGLIGVMVRNGLLAPAQVRCGYRLMAGAYKRLNEPAVRHGERNSVAAKRQKLDVALVEQARPKFLPAAVECPQCRRLCVPDGKCPGCGRRQSPISQGVTMTPEYERLVQRRVPLPDERDLVDAQLIDAVVQQELAVAGESPTAEALEASDGESEQAEARPGLPGDPGRHPVQPATEEGPSILDRAG